MTVDLGAFVADGHGHDTLVDVESVVGSRFADVLRGDGHDNWLTGREGADLFVFGPGSGADEIRGFEPGIDRVQLAGPVPASFDDFSASLEAAPFAVVIHSEGGSSISLVGIALSQPGAEDFLWV